MNTGVSYLRNTDKTHALLDAWLATDKWRTCRGWECGDQEILSAVLEACGWRAPSDLGTPSEPAHMLAMTGNAGTWLRCKAKSGFPNLEKANHTGLEVLPPRYFPTGKDVMVEIIKQDRTKIVTFHPNFSAGNSGPCAGSAIAKSKLAKIQKAGLVCSSKLPRR